MLPQAVEIAGDNRHLCKERGFLAIYEQNELLGRLPIDDLSLVLVCGYGVTWSNDLLASLSERCIPVVICGKNMNPLSMLWSLSGHHRSSERIRSQAVVSVPTQKRLWQSIIKAKILLQAKHVALRGEKFGHLVELASSVRSGDTGNVEAIAASLYWRLCFGMDFKRDRMGSGANSLLNYGYTVLRACMARAIMLSGLHPAFGIFHRNARNPMPLVDDLMEPFRPVVDMVVLHIKHHLGVEVNPDTKRILSGIPSLDMTVKGELSTVGRCIREAADSLAAVYLGQQDELVLPKELIPL